MMSHIPNVINTNAGKNFIIKKRKFTPLGAEHALSHLLKTAVTCGALWVPANEIYGKDFVFISNIVVIS